MSFRLSKSLYCHAVQCPKMVWLKSHKPELFDASVLKQDVLATGNEIGDLAMGLLGDYMEVPFHGEDPDNLTNMLLITAEYLKAGIKNITEASFSYDDCFCSVDLLHINENGHVELYEVKSSTEVHEIYKDDIAYQYHILSGLGFAIDKACLVHINKKYIRRGNLDISSFFSVEDLTEEAILRQQGVTLRIQELRRYMEQTSEPSIEIGEHCTAPYECGFWSHCAALLPPLNIFDVGNMQKPKKWKLYRSGKVSFQDLAVSGDLSEAQQLQVDHALNDLPPHIDTTKIKKCLSTLSFPLYFLDFESCNPAIPPFDGMHPFEQMVFQYSLHYIEHDGAPLCHTEFLAEPYGDPRRAVAEHLCKDIPLDVCVTAYNMSFERTRIKELATLYPDLREHLMNIHDHIQDLIVPFQKKWYYLRDMRGSYSIKYVLPALFPDDPKLDYHNLEGVHNGEEASNAFKRMSQMSPEELKMTRQQLLLYCGLDTYAMVKVWEKLCQASGTPVSITW